MPNLTLRLTLDVSYDTNGVDKQVLVANLHEIVEHAFGDGLVTGDTEAEVSSHHVIITCSMPPDFGRLDIEEMP